MAKYTVRKEGLDAYVVTARHQPFKGAATKQKSFRGPREKVPQLAEEAGRWVAAQRGGRPPVTPSAS